MKSIPFVKGKSGNPGEKWPPRRLCGPPRVTQRLALEGHEALRPPPFERLARTRGGGSATHAAPPRPLAGRWRAAAAWMASAG